MAQPVAKISAALIRLGRDRFAGEPAASHGLKQTELDQDPKQ
ncbi:MAG: hypothetical protein QNK37_27620 [Acidobacteriota bacterium]|nr:hypothetical protein [Acidobacteriota bacterium]